MTPVGYAVIDACTLWNFAVVGRLDLLEALYGQRVRWTETIRLEIARGVGAEPFLQQVLDAQWLGMPLPIAGDVHTLVRIEQIRRGLGAMLGQSPTLHLGEAEIIDLLETREPSWILVSDDRPAIDLANRRGLSTMDSRSVLADCYASGLIGCPDAFNVLQKMHDAGRGVRVPPDHRYVCP